MVKWPTVPFLNNRIKIGLLDVLIDALDEKQPCSNPVFFFAEGTKEIPGKENKNIQLNSPINQLWV